MRKKDIIEGVVDHVEFPSFLFSFTSFFHPSSAENKQTKSRLVRIFPGVIGDVLEDVSRLTVQHPADFFQGGEAYRPSLVVL